MLTKTNTMTKNFEARERANYSKRLQNLNGDKKFTNTSFLDKLDIKDIRARFAKIANAQEELTLTLEQLGCKPSEQKVEGTEITLKGIEYDGNFYCYSATEEQVEQHDLTLVSSLIDDIFGEDPDVQEAQKKHLGQYWVNRSSYQVIFTRGEAAVVYPGMSIEEAKEADRFLHTVEDYHNLKREFADDASFLTQYLRNHSVEELLAEGLINEPEDDSRSKSVEEKEEFLAGLSKDELTLWFLTRTAKKFFDNFYGQTERLDYREIYDLDYIVSLTTSCKGMVMPNCKKDDGTPCRVGVWTIFNRFKGYYLNGYIDDDVFAALADTVPYAIEGWRAALEAKER